MSSQQKNRLLACLYLAVSIATNFLCQPALCQEPVESHEVASPDETEIIVVVGAEGEPEFGEQFGKWAKTWRTFAERTHTKFTSIGLLPVGKQTDRDLLQAAIERITDRPAAAKHSSATWIVLIGHGTYSQRVAKFNLRGPDIAATEMSQWIQPIGSPLVIVNCSSSSSPFINQLSGENRVIVTATKSGTQYNFRGLESTLPTRFHRWIQT